jgi:hypothetical protein
MLSTSEILKEYALCLKSPIYAIENYLQTFDKTREGFVPFKLFPRQKEIIYAYEKHRFNLVTKPRQAGVSTTTAAYMAVKVGFADLENPEAVLIIANKQELAFEFLAKIKDFLSQLPRWVWGPEYYGTHKNEEKSIFLTDSKKEIKLPNGSRVKAVATSKDALRGFTPTYLVMDEAAYIDNGAEVFGAALTALGTGGRCVLISCVTEDSFVFTNDGIKQVSDFIQTEKSGEYNTDFYGVLGNGKIRHSNIMFNNGYQKTLKIKTTSSNLEATKTHLVWGYKKSLKKYGWYNVGLMEIGDYLNIQYGQNLWGGNDKIDYAHNFNNKEKKPTIIYDKITPDLAYLIGLYISEGSCYKKYNDNGELVGVNITITCGDDISEAINKAGFNFSSHDKLHYVISSKYFGGLLESLGFDLSLKATNKVIPPRLMSISKENMVGLIQGIMDGDGYSTSDRCRVGISLSSKKLIEQLRVIFLNFGILTDFFYGKTKKTKKVSVESNYFRIVANNFNALKYFNEIGFRFERKQKNINVFKETTRTTQSKFIPNGKEIIRQIAVDNKLTRKLKKHGLPLRLIKDSKTGSKDINEETFVKFIKVFQKEFNIDLYSYNIDKILFENSKWEPITGICDGEALTYDFSLPNIIEDYWSHSVLYNGILGHQTPKGMDALYYKTYDQARKKENNFNIIEMKWYEDLRYNKDLRWIKGEVSEPEVEFTFDSYNKRISDGWKPTSSWYEEMCRGMNNDAKMIAQELDVSFIGSGGSVIDEEYIEFQEKNNVTPPLYTDGPNNEIWIWAEPQEGHQYILGSDVSRGDGEDSSTIVIVDFTTMEQVMEYQGKIQPDLLAQIIEQYGNLYKAYTVIDVTGGMGVSTVLKLLEFDYKRLHYDNANGKILSSKQKELSNYNKENKIPGFHATSVRLPMISNLEYKVRTNAIKIRSVRLTSEMKTFIYRNGRPDHMDGYHDDCLYALAMCLWVLEHSFKNLERMEKQTKAILNSWKAGTSTTTTKTEPQQERQIAQQTQQQAPPPKPSGWAGGQTSKNPMGDYLWLFGRGK